MPLCFRKIWKKYQSCKIRNLHLPPIISMKTWRDKLNVMINYSKLAEDQEASPFLLFKILKGKKVFIQQCLAFSFRHIALPKDKVKGETLQDKNFFNSRWFQYCCRWIGSFSYDSQQFVFQRCLSKFCQIRWGNSKRIRIFSLWRWVAKKNKFWRMV